MHTSVIHPGAPWRATLLGAVAAAALWAAPAHAQEFRKEVPEELKGIELDPKLGQHASLDTQITDSSGKTVTLGSYFHQGKPVVLAMVYYNCPMICPLVLSRLQERLNAVPYNIGEDFNVVVVSFDARNTTQMAAENKAIYLAGLTKPLTPIVEKGWTFHTATTGNSRAIADSIGFRYRFYPESGEYGHPAVLTVLTSDGVVSGYVSGLEPEPNDLRMALLQASEGKIAKTLGDFFLHTCYRYDPKTGRFSMQAVKVMQMGGLLTVVGLTTLIVALRAGERFRAHKRAAAQQPPAAAAPAGGAT